MNKDRSVFRESGSGTGGGFQKPRRDELRVVSGRKTEAES
jgi:hypothetical protein